MGRRFSDVKRGGDLNAQLTAYVTYLQSPRVRRLNSLGDREPTIPVYLTPFDLDIATDEIALVRMSQASATAIRTDVDGADGAEVLAAAGAKDPVEYRGFTPAKILVFTNATKVKTVKRSKYTNAEYLSYAGDRYACPFGRASATDDERDVGNAIKAALRTKYASNQVVRLSLSVERWRA